MEKRYKIKPLEWEERVFSGNPILIAVVIHGCYVIRVHEDGKVGWSNPLEPSEYCDSIEHGKQLAQAHWESSGGIGNFLELQISVGIDWGKGKD